MLKRMRIYLALCCPLFLASPAYAATDNTTFQVTATINAVCNISATNLDFGVYDPFGATPLDATSTVTLNCTPNTAYSIALNSGLHSGGSFSSRSMKLATGPELMDYNVYRDAAHTEIWGDGTASTFIVSGTTPVGTPSPVNVTAYGRIPAGQNALPTGAYADTIDATVTF